MKTEPEVDGQKKMASLIRVLTLFVAEITFLGLVASFTWRTFAAQAGVPPDLPAVQVSAAGALAVALGGGYALILGIPSQSTGAGGNTSAVEEIKDLLGERLWLTLGVLLYLAAGMAACIAYGLNEAEAPSILKTIAVGFGGYVISYIGVAYQQIIE